MEIGQYDLCQNAGIDNQANPLGEPQMQFLKNFAAAMDRDMERRKKIKNPLLDPAWHDIAEQCLAANVEEMIATGRAQTIPVAGKRTGELSIDEQNRLDQLEDGIFG